MMKNLLALLLLVLSTVFPLRAAVTVRTVDFLETMDLSVNAAGPVLVRMDPVRDRVIVANTNSSSLSLIDGETGKVTNIPLGGRALQHLKDEALTIRRATGEVFLIGDGCFLAVSPESGSSRTIRTDVQFESIAVDESTGNVFLAGRESEKLGFLEAGSDRFELLDWTEGTEDLINANQTPPPPIRKVIADGSLGVIAAVDGTRSRIDLFDGGSGLRKESRTIGLTSGGRWHLAGYDGEEHALYLVMETGARNVIQAGRFDIDGREDRVVSLPGLREGVGIGCHPERDEVYIPYDNHPTVHVVSFTDGGAVHEVKIPAYGNDASTVDGRNDVLYVASWAHGEIDVVDLRDRRLVKRITGLGILPHMFTMTFDPKRRLLYFPRGATAVNGTFGTAVSVLDPGTEELGKIRTGWAPVDLIEVPGGERFLVFGAEDRMAEVRPDGSFEIHRLPYDFPVAAAHGPGDLVYLSYGPHQTYWPTVYIWGAKNGILTIDPGDLSFSDRRIPRQAFEMVQDDGGTLYFTQNNWGKEEQFLGLLPDEIRLYDPARRIALGDTVVRETTQRLLRSDRDTDRLYLVRVGETDDDPGILQVIDTGTRQVEKRITVGRTPTDVVVDDESIYVTGFDSGTISIIDRETFDTEVRQTDGTPLDLCLLDGTVYCIDHTASTLIEVGGSDEPIPVPAPGRPDNMFAWQSRHELIITCHDTDRLTVLSFDPARREFSTIHREFHPFGATGFDTRNSSFYLRGQFGDALFRLTEGREDGQGRLWITDFLAGKLFIIELD